MINKRKRSQLKHLSIRYLREYIKLQSLALYFTNLSGLLFRVGITNKSQKAFIEKDVKRVLNKNYSSLGSFKIALFKNIF